MGNFNLNLPLSRDSANIISINYSCSSNRCWPPVWSQTVKCFVIFNCIWNIFYLYHIFGLKNRRNLLPIPALLNSVTVISGDSFKNRDGKTSTSSILLPKIFDSVGHFHTWLYALLFCFIFAKVHRKKHSKEESRTRNGWSLARNIRSQNHPGSRVDAFKKKASYRSFCNIYMAIWDAGISH